ncbi:MAG: hypothetical protein M1834_006076 [Cirrosporium novae-zelandiae]|nr:MAG: hypothetical protein M1834_006076 [Cirrosporium novae-zelandiae]
MSLGSRTCWCAAQPNLSQPLEHIWISNDLLNNAWTRFATKVGGRRYGSSVPGPLEARRRQAKRHHMDIASTYRNPPMDIRVVLGMGRPMQSKDLRWSAPSISAPVKEPEDKDTNFLQKLLQPLIQISKPKEELPPIQEPQLDELDPFIQFQIILSTTSTYEGIRTLFKRLTCDDNQRRLYSWTAFHHLLEINANFSILLSFLKTPSLNDPRSLNCSSFLLYLIDRDSSLSTRQLRAFQAYIAAEFSHGRLLEGEIRQILRLWSKLKIFNRRIFKSALINPQLIAGWHMQMLASANSLSNLASKNKPLQNETVRVWLHQITEIPHPDLVYKLSMSLVWTCPIAQKIRLVEQLPNHFIRWLQSCYHLWHRPGAHCDICTRYIIKFLKNIPLDMAMRVIPLTTSVIKWRTERGTLPASYLGAWNRVLYDKKGLRHLVDYMIYTHRSKYDEQLFQLLNPEGMSVVRTIRSIYHLESCSQKDCPPQARVNKAMQKRLRKSHPKENKYSYPPPLNLGNPEESSRIFRLARTRGPLLHHIALSASTSPSLSPRRAFRKVHRCLLLLRRERLPVKSELTAALVYTGITRYLEKGLKPSRAQVGWVIRHVLRTQGYAAAMGLYERVKELVDYL